MNLTAHPALAMLARQGQESVMGRYDSEEQKQKHRAAVSKSYYKNHAASKERAKKYRDDNPEVFKERIYKWREENPDQYNSIVSKYKDANPEKVIAQHQVDYAIRTGVLVKPDHCSRCDAENPQAHHHDYSKPLDVIWLCPKCHKAEHMKESSNG